MFRNAQELRMEKVQLELENQEMEKKTTRVPINKEQRKGRTRVGDTLKEF